MASREWQLSGRYCETRCGRHGPNGDSSQGYWHDRKIPQFAGGFDGGGANPIELRRSLALGRDRAGRRKPQLDRSSPAKAPSNADENASAVKSAREFNSGGGAVWTKLRSRKTRISFVTCTSPDSRRPRPSWR